MPLRTLIIVLLSAALVAGCGRRGALEEPGARSAASASVAPAADVSPLDPGAPVVIVEPPAQSAAPRRRFLLDFLL